EDGRVYVAGVKPDRGDGDRVGSRGCAVREYAPHAAVDPGDRSQHLAVGFAEPVEDDDVAGRFDSFQRRSVLRKELDPAAFLSPERGARTLGKGPVRGTNVTDHL